ncbi:nitroreductase family deazaflavin-dependent oxidoreductase [Mycobacterium sp. GA-2829]|uniref:nitroreductase family deazaflavin-dependent oxidoreductase n=1 Tax=Mycobacterium sp. GA-2829 TaxID=1772283 RepID=UPI0007401862|nr:nitroreductase family deazaflavin-dependent oxidoreductase [Mycobacterium sp. GA-2829]KUI30233.1 cell entry protein [Mycobacterium sp. GA-2829]
MTETMDFAEMNRAVIAEFRANGGTAGGMFAGTPLLLLHHIGAKSGVERISPLATLVDDGRIFVFASKGGSDSHPDWYRNLLAHPAVIVELGTETFPATARVLTGAERDEIYAKQSALHPQFAEYQRVSKRSIPVVELIRSAADA